MTSFQSLARGVLRQFGSTVFPETLTWQRPGHPPVTCRCSLIPLGDLPTQKAAVYSTLPGFSELDVELKVHPDDPLPGLGSTVVSARLGRLTLKAYGPRAYLSGLTPALCGTA